MKKERVAPRSTKEKLKVFEVTVIGGTLKGKKIQIPDIHTTRSSKALLRESLFNTLQFDIMDKNFVEVFAGSGSVGIEAISRGAGHGYFIEKNRNVYRILCDNIAHLNITNATVMNGDSFELFVSLYAGVKRSGIPAYFYFDPPFSTREGMEEIYDKTLDLITMIEPEVCEMVIIEHMSSLDLPDQIGALALTRRKRFGKSSLSYYRTRDIGETRSYGRLL